MTDIVKELRLPASIDQADTQRRLAADEIERLRAHIAEIEAWQKEGVELFDSYNGGLNLWFGLGKWWGERPWRT